MQKQLDQIPRNSDDQDAELRLTLQQTFIEFPPYDEISPTYTAPKVIKLPVMTTPPPHP